MLAFAGNSVLCRLALADQQIDPATFTSVRLVAGAMMLVLIVLMRRTTSIEGSTPSGLRKSFFSAAMLFAYALFFSYAYIDLDTATGALVLFGIVQITLIGIGIAKGKTLHSFEWLGLAIACGGFVFLLLPELNTPTLSGLLMMAIAGIAWGVYTALGQGSVQPLIDTKTNFVLSVPMVFILVLICAAFGLTTGASSKGIILAVISGAITSALGYAIWYAVLPKLDTTVAAVIQLSVPVIAAILGLLLVNEVPSLHLIVSGLTILLGIFLVIITRNRIVQNQT